MKNKCQVKIKNNIQCKLPFYNNLTIDGNVKNVCKRHYNDCNIRHKKLNFTDIIKNDKKNSILLNYTKIDPFEPLKVNYIQTIKNSILQYIHQNHKHLEFFIDVLNEECACNQLCDDNEEFNSYIQKCIPDIFNIIKNCLKTHQDINDCNISFNGNYTLCQFIFTFKNENEYCEPIISHLYRVKEKECKYFCIHVQYLTMFTGHIDYIQRIKIII